MFSIILQIFATIVVVFLLLSIVVGTGAYFIQFVDYLQEDAVDESEEE